MLAWLTFLRRSVVPARTPAPHSVRIAAPAPAGAVARAAAAAPVPAPAPELPPPVAVAAPAPSHSALSWLLDIAPPVDDAPTPSEQALLRALDPLLRSPTLPGDLLPRAPSVIPQLIALLRQTQPSRSALVQQVTKDVLLTAEVLRLARSPFYGSQPVETLESALDRIGTIGLQSAMSRVLFKPVYHAPAGSLMARAAPRLWAHAEHKSMVCAEIVARDGGDRFDGFLAGLMHDTGWVALLRLMDRHRLVLPLPCGVGLDAALDARKDLLFGRLTAGWGLTPGLTALSQHLGTERATAPPPALANALQAADRRCTAELAGLAVPA